MACQAVLLAHMLRRCAVLVAKLVLVLAGLFIPLTASLLQSNVLPVPMT